VTRPRAQAAQLAQRIEQAGGRVISFPLLEISPAADPQRLHELAARLHEFKLVIFISPNAVRYAWKPSLRRVHCPPNSKSPPSARQRQGAARSGGF